MGITVAGGLLMVVNLAFLVAGVLLIKFTTDLKSTGWLEALDETDYQSAAGTMVTAVMALGVVTLALALLGFVGAITRNRVMLMVYAIAMVVAMIIFGVIGGTAYSFGGQMEDWEKAEFPADDTEAEFAGTFNEIYCFAQGAYLCNTATTEDLLGIFFPTLPAETAALLPKMEGLNSMCADGDLGSILDLDSVCGACADAEKFNQFEEVLTWANDKCPSTAATATWCATFLESGTPGPVYENSPYQECRTSFLDVVISWGHSLALMGLLAGIAAALLLILSRFARRKQYGGSKA